MRKSRFKLGSTHFFVADISYQERIIHEKNIFSKQNGGNAAKKIAHLARIADDNLHDAPGTL